MSAPFKSPNEENPDEPVHLHSFVWWSVSGHTLTICENRAVWHTFSKWDDICPGNEGGADFSNQWQIFERYAHIDEPVGVSGTDSDDLFRGRNVSGWSSYILILNQGIADGTMFLTRKEADQEVLGIRERSRDSLREQAATEDREIALLKERLKRTP